MEMSEGWGERSGPTLPRYYQTLCARFHDAARFLADTAPAPPDPEGPFDGLLVFRCRQEYLQERCGDATIPVAALPKEGRCYRFREGLCHSDSLKSWGSRLEDIFRGGCASPRKI